jgi:hypothetical protein
MPVDRRGPSSPLQRLKEWHGCRRDGWQAETEIQKNIIIINLSGKCSVINSCHFEIKNPHYICVDCPLNYFLLCSKGITIRCFNAF